MESFEGWVDFRLAGSLKRVFRSEGRLLTIEDDETHRSAKEPHLLWLRAHTKFILCLVAKRRRSKVRQQTSRCANVVQTSSISCQYYLLGKPAYLHKPLRSGLNFAVSKNWWIKSVFLFHIYDSPEGNNTSWSIQRSVAYIKVAKFWSNYVLYYHLERFHSILVSFISTAFLNLF